VKNKTASIVAVIKLAKLWSRFRILIIKRLHYIYRGVDVN